MSDLIKLSLVYLPTCTGSTVPGLPLRAWPARHVNPSLPNLAHLAWIVSFCDCTIMYVIICLVYPVMPNLSYASLELPCRPLPVMFLLSRHEFACPVLPCQSCRALPILSGLSCPILSCTTTVLLYFGYSKPSPRSVLSCLAPVLSFHA